MPAKRGPGPQPGAYERVYETDIARKYAPVPKIVTAKPIDPSFYMNSRAYANARGVQKDLNIPYSSNATTPGSGLPGIGPPPVSRGSGGGGRSGGGTAAPVDPLGGYVPEVFDPSKNPFPAAYDQLLSYIKANADQREPEYAAMGEAFKQRQAEANKQMYDPYMASRASADESARALGADPAVISAARDLAMRKSQENSDQSLADNLAWLAKAGLLSRQQAEAMGNQYAAEKASKSANWVITENAAIRESNLAALQAILAQKQKSSGGSGGRGRGGGGGSSGSTGVTESMTSDDPRLDAYIASLPPGQRAVAERMYNAGGAFGNPTKLAQEEFDKQVQIANQGYKPVTLQGPKPNSALNRAVGNIIANINKAKAQTQLHTVYSPVIQATKYGSGKGSHPSTKVTETTKGRAT